MSGLRSERWPDGYLYQSVLRAEVAARYGLRFDPIVNGQAEIAGVPTELLDQFSKRAREIEAEMGDKLADFAQREGRDPTDFEYAANTRSPTAHECGGAGAQLRDLEGVAYDAGRLCHALEEWKYWANGRNLDNAALAEIAATLSEIGDYAVGRSHSEVPHFARRCGAVDVFAIWDYRVGQASAYVPISRRSCQSTQ